MKISTAEKQQLTNIRNDIDAIDKQIQNLIAQRAECAQEVANIKTQGGQVEAVFYRPEREAQVLREVKERNNSLLSDDTMMRLFREIMSVCLALEQPLKVAYLGPEGSYSHASVLKQFGSFAHPYAVSSIEDVFKSVENGEVSYGLVPVENSSEGVVKQTQNCLINTPLKVSGEVELAIHHCLLSKNNKLENIHKIVAHTQALGQCENWLKNNMPWVVTESVNSNALAAQMAREDDSLGAIASEQAAQLYELQVIESHIEDQADNTTKFWVLGAEETEISGDDKTAFVLALPNKSGSLMGVLDSLASRNISMQRIISLPSTDIKWDYLFFINIEGHQNEKLVEEALTEIKQKTSFFKLLGSFPASPMT